MEHIKQNFSIKDLENLSGIKAHTIRIWEKRYNILDPQRTDTNIRTYSGDNLQKLLNISFLNSNGYKISRISKMENEEIQAMVKRISSTKSLENRSINNFKIAMMNFDDELFEKTYAGLEKSKKFSQIFEEVFIPLLNEIGMLWQTDTIKPIHEHYLTELIKQKLYTNLEDARSNLKISSDRKLYILFLPMNEIHDLGLLYVYYCLLREHKNTIYLGSSLAISDLVFLLEKHKNMHFVSYFTIFPDNCDISDFISEFQEQLCADERRELSILGPRSEVLENKNIPSNIKGFKKPSDFLRNL